MATNKLTSARVRTAPVGKHFDGDGLYLEVLPNDSRLWRLKYRFGGKEKRLALGALHEVGIAEARRRRDEARAHLRDGRDPSEVRRAVRVAAVVRAANSFEAVAREWIATRGVCWSERHRENLLAQLERDAFPKLGGRPVSELSPTEILSVLRDVERRGSLDSAGRLLQRIRGVLNFAVATGRAESNPARDLNGALTPPMRRNFAALPLARVGAFLAALDDYPGQPETRIALHLLLLTFVRSGELRGARWIEFDLAAKDDHGQAAPTWSIPAERMKNRRPHVVPLAPKVVELLGQLRELSGHGEFLFPHRVRPRTPMGDSTLLAGLQRMGFGDVTAHGFRALASTELNGLGFRPDAIERQLAHVEANKIRSAYHRTTYLDERRTMMIAWADMIEGQCDGAGKVVPFRRAAG